MWKDSGGFFRYTSTSSVKFWYLNHKLEVEVEMKLQNREIYERRGRGFEYDEFKVFDCSRKVFLLVLLFGKL